MGLGVNVVIRNLWLQAVADKINAGTGPGLLNIYSGTRPATGGTPTTLLGTLTCSDPCEASVANGVLTFSPIAEEGSADAAGTATWGRFTDSAGGFVTDASVGESGSGADIILNSCAVTLGGIIRVNSGTLTAGNA